MPDYLVDAALFGISFGSDIYKCRMPASHFAVGNGRQQELFFFNIDKGRQLVVLLVEWFVCIGFGWDGVCFELSVEYLCYEFARLIDANIVFAHQYAGEIALVTEACQCIDFGCRRYGTFVDNGIVHKTIGAVHGDVAVYQFPFLQGGEVIDDDTRTSGRNEYLYAFGFGGFQRFDGGNGIWWVLKLTSVPSMSKNRALIIYVSF